MAKPLKDFFKELQTKGAIKSTDLDTVLSASALNDIELPDDFVTGFESSFLTVDRAKNDPAIVAEIQKASNRSAFAAFDEKVNGFFQFIDPADVEEIKKTDATYEKYDKLKAALKKSKEAGKGKLNEDANKIQEQLNQQIVELKAAHKIDLKAQEEKINTAITNGMLKTKILAFKFADAFTPLRESIAELITNNVRGKFVLSMDKGELKLLQPVPGSDTLVEAYEGNNEKLTVDKLLERELDKFIAKSNGTGGNEGGNQPPAGGAPKVPDLKTATLAQLRQFMPAQ